MRKNVIRISNDAKKMLDKMAEERKLNYGALVEILIEREWNDMEKLRADQMRQDFIKFSGVESQVVGG